jgi:hypothetical protein
MSIYRQKIEVPITVVGKVVMIDLHGSGEVLELAYNDPAARFEMLIEAEVVKRPALITSCLCLSRDGSRWRC